MEAVQKTTFAGITPLSIHESHNGQNGMETGSNGDEGVVNFYPSMEEASKQIYEVGCTSCLCFQETPTVFGRERFFVISFSDMVNVPKQCRYRFVNHETERQRRETVGLLLKNHKSSKMHAVRIHSRIQVGMSDEQAEVNRKMVKKYYQGRQKHCKDLLRCYLDTVAAFPEIQVCWNAHYLPSNHTVIKSGVDLFSARLWAKGKARVLEMVKQGKLKHLQASENDVKMASFIYESTSETDDRGAVSKQSSIVDGTCPGGAGDGAAVAGLLAALTGTIYTCNNGSGGGNTGSHEAGGTPAASGGNGGAGQQAGGTPGGSAGGSGTGAGGAGGNDGGNGSDPTKKTGPSSSQSTSAGKRKSLKPRKTPEELKKLDEEAAAEREVRKQRRSGSKYANRPGSQMTTRTEASFFKSQAYSAAESTLVMTAQQSVLASVRRASPVGNLPATNQSQLPPISIEPQAPVVVTVIQPNWPTAGPLAITSTTAPSTPTETYPPGSFPIEVADEISRNVTGILGVKAHQKAIEDAPTEELNTAMVEDDLGFTASPPRSEKARSFQGSPKTGSPQSQVGNVSDLEIDEAVPDNPAAASAVQQTIKLACMDFERIYDKVRLQVSNETSQYLDDMWRKLMFIRHESNLNNLTQDQQLLFTRAKRVVSMENSVSLLVDLDQLVDDWKRADAELEAAKKKVPVGIDEVKKLLSLLPKVYPNSADLATWSRLANLLRNCSIYSSYSTEQEQALAEARQIHTAEKIRLESMGHTVNNVNLLLEAQLSLNQQQEAKQTKGKQTKKEKAQKKPAKDAGGKQSGVSADDYAYHNIAQSSSSTPSKGKKRGAPSKQEKQANKKRRSEAAAAALNEDEKLGFASSDEETPEQREELKLRKKAIHTSSDPAIKALYAAQLASDTMQRANVKKMRCAARANNSLLKTLQNTINDIAVTCAVLAERHQETESNSAIRNELGMGLMGWKTIYPIRDVFSNPNKILLLEKYVLRNVTNEGGTYACNFNDELFEVENRWRFYYRDPKSCDYHEEPRYQLGVECWVLPEAMRRFLRDCAHAYSLRQEARAKKGIVNLLDPPIGKPDDVIKSWVNNFRNHRSSNNFRKERIDLYKKMWWYDEDPLMQQYGEICYLDGKESLYVTWKTPVPDTTNQEEVRLYVAENLKDVREAYGSRLNERKKQQDTMRKEANYKRALDQEELTEQWAEEVVRSPLGVANFERHQVLTKAAAKAISRGMDPSAILEKLREDRPESYPRPEDDPDDPSGGAETRQ